MTPVPATLLVVKIGGSLAETGRLAEILALIGAVRRPVVVVPGGGPFADAVRNAQSALGFGDMAAHRMALLAMHQMAAVMMELQPRLLPVETLAALKKAAGGDGPAIWLPYRLAAADRRIAEDWTITSDGLAARLAERAGRARLVLVKSRTVDRAATAAALVQAGIVDPAFPVIVARAKLDWRVLGPGEEGELAELLGLDANALPAANPSAANRIAGKPRSGAPDAKREPV